MLQKLGRLIEKRPWLVVTIILLITIGFSLFIPGLQFKTNFSDFAPDNDLVKANNRITEYFGTEQQMLLLLINTQQAESTITPQAIRDQYQLKKTLEQNPDVNSSVSIITFIDTICLMEFNKTIENCTDTQLQTAIQDLLTPQQNREIQILQNDDPNEAVDYPGRTRRTASKNIDSTDIKNIYLSKDNKTITFSIEVYDLQTIQQKIKSPFPKTNIMEWYVQFENTLLPAGMEMTYKIAARIQPTYTSWEIGNGLLDNTRQLLWQLRSRSLFSSYTIQPYLWVTPPGQTMSYPIPLTTGNITFADNKINIIVSKEELGTYGIAPQFGSFEIPAKLSNFTAGVRFYQSPVLHRPGGRISINVTYLFNRIDALRNRPLMGTLLTRFLTKNGMTWEQYDTLTETMGQTSMLPDSLSLNFIETLWTQADNSPDSGLSETIFPILPKFFDDLRINALSFLSKDYNQTKTPKASLMIITLNLKSSDSADLAEVNNMIIDTVTNLDEQFSSLSFQVTGEGIISTQINDVAMDAMTIIAPMIFIIIICILFIAFRKPSYFVLPILVFAFSCIWLFGTMSLLGISFNIIAVALLPLNIGLGVEYSVNILFNYRTELNKGRTPAEAVRLSIKEVGIAVFLAWFTTFVAFLSFLTASIPPIRDFGIFLALGITYTFFITMTLLVALRYILDRNKKSLTTTNNKPSLSMINFMGNLAKILLHHQKKVFIITIIISLIMGAAFTQVKTGFSMDQFMPQDNPALGIFTQINENFPFSSQDQVYIFIEGENIATVKMLQGVDTTYEKLNNDQFVTRKTDRTPKTESIYVIMQQAVANNHSLVSLYNVDESTSIPRTDSDVHELFDYLYDSNEYGMQTKNVLYKKGDDYTASVVRVYVDFRTDSEDMTKEFEQLNTELNNDLAEYGDATSMVTGNLLITLTILKNMTESQIVSTLVCFALAAFMLSIIYRNPLLGLIAMIPVTISIVWVLGTMYFIGYQLNIMTIMVTCITIGVGIDYACYITERFRLVVDQTGDTTKAVTETISRTGSAIVIAACSSMFGFGVLAFAPIPPLQQFGIITAITLIYAFITSIVVLPLVLARWANWRKKRKGYIIRPGPPRGLEGIDDSFEYRGEQ